MDQHTCFFSPQAAVLDYAPGPCRRLSLAPTPLPLSFIPLLGVLLNLCPVSRCSSSSPLPLPVRFPCFLASLVPHARLFRDITARGD